MRTGHAGKRRGFSLIELVIVVVIIGILAAIAIPRLSRGSAGAAESALAGNLAVLRSAIDLYATEHGGKYPSVANFAAQLTSYTDIDGGASATSSGTYLYGPYLRKVPPLPVGPANYRGSTTVVDGSTGTPGTNPGGWFYNAQTGQIRANLADAEVDGRGVAYNTY
jgi:prepilin-type N-terminal cleavage/methylation domain-containing protein